MTASRSTLTVGCCAIWSTEMLIRCRTPSASISIRAGSLLIERERHHHVPFKRIALRAARRADPGLAARHAQVEVQNRRRSSRGDARAVGR